MHLDLTFWCPVEAFCVSFSAQSIYGLIMTYVYRFPSLEIMMKVVMELADTARGVEKNETEWRE